jgi:tetratricopeptide (TPR) repeat protein
MVHRIQRRHCFVILSCLVLSAITEPTLWAQSGSFQIGSESTQKTSAYQTPSNQTSGLAQRKSPVSDDLLAVFKQTSTATQPSDFSAIIDVCQNAVGDSSRSKADRNYAQRLLSWAANRRGEILSDEAARLVSEEQMDSAARLDQRAANDFRLALKYDSNRWRARHNLAISLALENKIDEAIEQFTIVTEQKPSYANAYFNRGELKFQMRRFDDAIADYSLAIEQEPKNPENYSARGHAQFFNENYESAVADYRQASELAPKSAEFACDHADACQSLYQWKTAGFAYRKTLSIDSSHQRALQNAAWLMATCPDASVRNPKGAIQAVDQLFAIGVAKDFRVWDTIAAAQAASGDFATAKTSIEQAIRQAPADELADLEYRASLYRRNRAYVQSSSEPTTVQTGSSSIGTGKR